MVEYGTAPQKCTRRTRIQTRSMKFRCQWVSQYITSVDLSLSNMPVWLLCFHLWGVALFQSVIACEIFSLHNPLRPASDEGRHKYTWTDLRRTTIPGWIHSWMKPPCGNLMWHSVSLKTWGFNISKQTDLKRLAGVDSSWCHHACWMCTKWLQPCQHAQGGKKAIRTKDVNVPTCWKLRPAGFLYLNEATGNHFLHRSWKIYRGSLTLQ